MIKVEKNANGTNAYQANRNLVLSDKVKCDTKPILEIESNQLRCTHGATVGRLEEQQLFYLRSRGLTEGQARDVLIEAFLDPVLCPRSGWTISATSSPLWCTEKVVRQQ